MNKSELVEALAQTTGTTKTASEAWLNAFTDTVCKKLKKEDVRLSGFGTFASVKRKARKGRNPQTGEQIKIAAKRVPVFRASKLLKDAFSTDSPGS